MALALASGGHALGSLTVPSLEVLEAQTGTGTERGIVRIRCSELHEGYWRLTRGIVVDLGDATLRHDVVLAPAHGLPADPERIEKNCRISNANGASVKIARFWFSAGRGEGLDAAGGMADDWAVLLTASPLPGDVGRLRTAIFAPEPLQTLVDREATVAVMLSKAAADQTGCRLLERLEPEVFLHSCRSWRGLSGAPILIGVDGEPVVVGINIAHMVRPVEVSGPLFLGVGVAIDEEIEATIRKAADRARADDAGRPVRAQHVERAKRRRSDWRSSQGLQKTP
jgi:hypothetical protein